MKEFNFTEALEKGRNPAVIMYYHKSKDQVVSKKEFIEEMRLLKRYSKSKWKGKNYSVKSLGKQYDKLKKHYGFYQKTKELLVS